MSKKILLVEDEALIALSEDKKLEKHGYEVVTVYNGEKAIETVDSDPEISLILMDIDLGKGIDGTEASQKILEKHNLPIVFLTSHSEKEYVDKVKKITNYGYVLKNSGEFVLIEAIRMAYQLFDGKKHERERRYKRVEKTAKLGIWEMDIETGESFWSDEFFRICGYLPGSIIPNSDTGFSIIHNDDKDRAAQAVTEAINTGKPYDIEKRIVRPDGEVRWVHSIGEVKFDENGTTKTLVGSFQDITERKKIERLKEEVDRITRHDIRSSLNGIIGIPQILKDESNLTATQKEYLQMISESGSTILNMINLSLSLYKIEEGTYEYSGGYFDLLKVCRHCITENHSLIDSKNIEVVISTEEFDVENPEKITVFGEELLAYSVVSNLVKNAVEASPSDSIIRIEITGKAPILFSVHNQGSVPKKIRNTFFNNYSTTGKKGGTGIGTYSAKILSEAQGWTIGMQTSEENGTKVTVTIPKADGTSPMGPMPPR